VLQLKHPNIHGYVGADLNEKREPIKIVCDVLEVVHYVLDSQTSPLGSLAVTFARVDPNNGFLKAGPQTQHMITGLELIEVLAKPEGITIDVIEASTLKTGIPGSHIRPEDIAPYLGAKPQLDWYGRIIEDTKRKLAAMAGVPLPGMASPVQDAIPEGQKDG
jgi:hypothetical protein